MSGLDYQVDGETRTAPVWVPPGFDPSRRWPLVVFLHGSGERGEDGENLRSGLALALDRWPERFPCIVVMPQCPRSHVWAAVDHDWALGHADAGHHIDAVYGAALEELAVDPENVVLTGLSMGGFGTFVHGARHIQRYRRLLAVCGGGFPADGERLAQRPLWVIHGADDDLVLPECSREMVAAVRAAGGDVRYDEYPGVGHNSWDRAYADPEVAAWLVG